MTRTKKKYVYPNAQSKIDQSRLLCGPELWAAFETSAELHGKHIRVGPALEEAAAWLRDYERRATAIRVHPPDNDGGGGGAYTGGGLTLRHTVDSCINERQALIDDALAGDEHAEWRVSELFGVECLERKKVG